MDLVAIGTVRTAWGVKGWLKLKSFSGEWDHFSALEKITLRNRHNLRDKDYRVEEFRMLQGGGLIKLAGIDNPEDGRLLAGCELLVPRELGAALKENEWYLGDLVGLALVNPEGTVLGEITGIVESADDLLEIRKTDGKSVLIPFRSDFVGEPDIDKGVLVLTALWLMDES